MKSKSMMQFFCFTTLTLALSLAGDANAQSAARQAALDARAAEHAAQMADRDGLAAQRDAAAAEQAAALHSRDAAEQRGRREPLSERDELAIAALEGLMSAPDARAMPILQKVLAGDHGDAVKSRALFVISQSDHPDAQKTLLDYVRNNKGRLQGEAIRMIGIGGDAKALNELMSIQTSGDGKLLGNVLQAFLIADRKDLVFQIAKSARNESEAKQAIHTLSAMGAVDELRQLGADGKYSRSLIQAYAVAGDLQSLRRVAEGNGDIAQREEAVRSLGIIGNAEAQAALREVYQKNDAPRLREAALQGMMISGDEQGVLTLYRAARTHEDKRNLLRVLSTMGGDAALEAIDAALQENAP